MKTKQQKYEEAVKRNLRCIKSVVEHPSVTTKKGIDFDVLRHKLGIRQDDPAYSNARLLDLLT